MRPLHRANASRVPGDFSYLRSEVARRLVDRLEDVRQRDFALALDLGALDGCVGVELGREDSLSGNGGGIGGVRRLVEVGRTGGARDTGPVETMRAPGADEETLPLPFPDASFDLVVSSMALHWVSDLPGTFREVNRVLKPDGAFLVAVPGGQTLPELRSSLLLAEQERDGGVSAHTGPFVDVASLAAPLSVCRAN
ncbi:hypothetical protein TeGR_g342 [Tetraparma gracilis]|uniref:Methyltransferase type 11 domain-containing protein n=1 Tax=Tetraparma gracilis TaxID=2962635 RepID=A0ABQ6MVU8_9STRA|nr:hypothetical protein TeGR_g342 [Tetraparma gracilis]